MQSPNANTPKIQGYVGSIQPPKNKKQTDETTVKLCVIGYIIGSAGSCKASDKVDERSKNGDSPQRS